MSTVKLFAFGTIRDYAELKDKDAVWTLTDAQLEKLRMLSVVSIARSTQIRSETSSDQAKAKHYYSSLSIPYAQLAIELQIISEGTQFDDKLHTRPLEDVLIQCVYSNIIAGKLDQASKAFIVESHVTVSESTDDYGSTNNNNTTATTVHGSLLSRDVDTTTPTSTHHHVKRMISTLEQFLSSSNKLVQTLEDISKVSASLRKEDEKRWRSVEKSLSSSEESGGGSGYIGGRFRAASGGGGVGGGGDPMEVVDVSGRRKVKRSRGGGVGGR